MKKNTKIVVISDLHSNLDFSVPEADLLLIAGDAEPAYHNAYLSINLQKDWLDNKFRNWLKEQPVKECLFIPGNHSWIWYIDKKEVPIMNSNFHYLEDEMIELFNLKIYGTPWQIPFNGWAFNIPEKFLPRKWDNIPENLDILLCHSPPYGIMDEVGHNSIKKHIGSKSLLKRIKEIKPTYIVFGHNHGGYGIMEEDGTTFVNCSLLNEDYEMVNEPIVFEL